MKEMKARTVTAAVTRGKEGPLCGPGSDVLLPGGITKAVRGKYMG